MQDKKLVIGFGTGRNGSTSMAKWLDSQPGCAITHEKVKLRHGGHPVNNLYWDSIAQIMDYPGEIVGDIAPYWLWYIDRILVDFPDAFIFNLDRESVVTVADSFWSYVQHDERIVDNDGSLWLYYPVMERYKSRDGIQRTVERYVVYEKILRKVFKKRITVVPTRVINEKSWQRSFLRKLGIPRDKQILGMPRLNSAASIAEYRAMSEQERKGDLGKELWNNQVKGNLQSY